MGGLRSSTGVRGHIKSIQCDCVRVPPGLSTVISESWRGCAHLHTVTRLHQEESCRPALSFRRRINITAIFMNNSFIVWPNPNHSCMKITHPRRNQLWPEKGFQRVNLGKFSMVSRPVRELILVVWMLLVHLRSRKWKRLVTNPPVNYSFVSGCFAAYLQLHLFHDVS